MASSTLPCPAGVITCPDSSRSGSVGREHVTRIQYKCLIRVKVRGTFSNNGDLKHAGCKFDGGVAMAASLRPVALTKSSVEVETPAGVFPGFLPPEVQALKEPAARLMASKIQRLPVQTSLSKQPIQTSCVGPSVQGTCNAPLLLVHGFDSSLLEWRRLLPLLEAGGVEAWAIDVLGWGFSNTDGVTSFGAAAKREHLYQFWKTHVKKPVIIVGASLGGSIAIDFAVAHPDAVAKLILIDAQGFAKGLGNLSTFPKFLAYAGIAVLRSRPLRSYANYLAFYKTNIDAILEGMRVGRLHTLVPGWADASVNFMLSGGYSVASNIPEVQQEALVIWGEQDKILPKEYAERFKQELPKAQLSYVKDAGHVPHVEAPDVVARMILQFIGQG